MQRIISDWVLGELKGYIGPNEENVIVHTTLDLNLQSRVEKIIEQHFRRHGKKLNFNQCAVIVMSPSGAIVAMVGGRDYQKSQFFLLRFHLPQYY